MRSLKFAALGVGVLGASTVFAVAHTSASARPAVTRESAVASAQTTSPVASPTPTDPPSGATASASPIPTSTPTPATTLAPAPPPAPLIAYEDADARGRVHVVDMMGHGQWYVDPSRLGGQAAHPWNFVTGGSRLFFSAAGRVTVLDRNGRIIGGGVGPADSDGPPAVDPTGTRWTWAHVTSDLPPNGDTTGSFWVAGLNEPAHVVYRWSLKAADMTTFFWSDRGIVAYTFGMSCGSSELSSALLDPATGRLTPLYSSDRHLTDVHAGLTVGSSTSSLAVLVGGSTSFSVPESRRGVQDANIGGARISPDGAHIAVPITGLAGCGGEPIVWTDIIDVSTHAHHVIPNVFAASWVDDGHFVASDMSDARTLRVVDLAGGSRIVGAGQFVGVMS